MADSPVVRQLSTDDLRKLVESAASSSRPKGRTLTSAQRQAIREICTATDYQSQRPEQLLIAFKASLNEAANNANIPPSPERNDLLALFVSVFIEELYGAVAGRRTAGDGDGDRTVAARIFIPSRNPS